MTPLRLMLVDDHAVVRIGLRNLLGEEPGFRVVAEAESLAETVPLAAQAQPDVVLLDLRLKDGSGVEVLGALKAAVPGVRVVILTSYAEDAALLAALKAGADGYLLKDVAAADLIAQIRRLAEAGAVMPSLPPRPPTGPAAVVEPLTPQESRLFELVGRGLANREVAVRSGLSEKTVRNYLSRVFEKLGVRRRSELVALYVARRGWGPREGDGR